MSCQLAPNCIQRLKLIVLECQIACNHCSWLHRRPNSTSRPSVSEHHCSCIAQESRAKQTLKAAIKAEHVGTEDSDNFLRAIGCAVIDFGLRPRGGFGFQLSPVTFTNVGIAIAAVKKNSHLASSNMTAIIADLHLQQYFSYAADVKSEKHLTMHVAHVLPNAHIIVKSLLPDVAWRDKGPSPFAADHTANASVDEGHAQTPTAALKQFSVPEPQAVEMPSAPHTPTGLDKPQAVEQQADTKISKPSSGFAVSLHLQALPILQVAFLRCQL